MPVHHPTNDASKQRRRWSPYRKEEVIVTLPDDRDDWDPVTKIEYLSSLEETGPGAELILEARRQALPSEQGSVDIRKHH